MLAIADDIMESDSMSIVDLVKLRKSRTSENPANLLKIRIKLGNYMAPIA